MNKHKPPAKGASHLTTIRERLRQTETELKNANERLEAVLGSITDAYYAVDDEWRLIEFNDTAEKLFLGRLNRPKEALVGAYMWDLVPGYRESAIFEHYQKAMRDRLPVHFEGKSLLAERWFEANAYPRPGRLDIYLRDITGRKKAEETLQAANAELKRRTYELEGVNRELEAFSYTVSHDLKAPLRSIEGFTQAVLEDCADRLGEAGKDYLRRVHSASRRMAQLIDAMLNMSRLTRGELRERVVDLSSLAQVIARDLQKKEPERRVEFLIAEKLKVNGDPAMLQVVLENLMENAWKFTSGHETAKIEFGAVDMYGNKVYYVRDDGAGFDPAYSDKLFMPFKRLHSTAEFPGLGMGLAIAHRIISRHNGRMWAEAAPEKGATVFFTV